MTIRSPTGGFAPALVGIAYKGGMSVRNAVARVRPHRPGSARARGTLSAIGAAGSLLAASVAMAAVALALLAGVSGTAVLATVMALLFLAAAGLLGWGVRRAVRGALRPVGRLDSELARAEDAEAGARVAVPPTGDDVERLAGRVNGLLARLDDAAMRRRRFISDASHELRTPVAGLRARIELALAAPDEGEPGETLRRSLHDIDRLHQIIDDLFVLARLDNGDAFGREALDLGALIETELGRRDAAVRTAVKVERGLRVEVNPQGLCRVLLNLLANAERHARTRVEVEVSADGDEAVVEVRDDGPGVPPAERERIFELFARLDSARSRADGGSGLGLPVARRIAIAHDGRLYVADHPHGARFVLRLPLAKDR